MKNILCFGDSNTYGLIPGTDRRYPWGIRWTSIVDEQVHGWGYRVVEEGLCGRTTIFEDRTRQGRNGSSMLPVLLETHNPVDIVVLMLGTNDCKTAYNTTPEKIGEGVEKLIEQIQNHDSNIKILLVSPIELGEGVWETGYDTEFDRKSVEVSRRLPQVYREIAERKNIEFIAASQYAVPGEADREHMDKISHRNFANAVVNKLGNMIARSDVHNSIYYEKCS
jgi:lysophospholipase L1-like esterase